MEAAFFDLDKTVIAKASMVAFGRPVLREGLVSRRMMLRALYGQLVYMHFGASEEKLSRVRESALRLTKGWDQARVQEIVRDVLEGVVEPIIYREAADLIEEHKAAGREVYLVSASPEEIVAPLAEYLGVDGAIASRAKLDDEGRYSGEMERYSYGPFKAEAMHELAAARRIDMAASYAYSDSYTDAPMLEVVGHPFAVNPTASWPSWPRTWVEVLESPSGAAARSGPRPRPSRPPRWAARSLRSAGALVWCECCDRRRPPVSSLRGLDALCRDCGEGDNDQEQQKLLHCCGPYYSARVDTPAADGDSHADQGGGGNEPAQEEQPPRRSVVAVAAERLPEVAARAGAQRAKRGRGRPRSPDRDLAEVAARRVSRPALSDRRTVECDGTE